MAEERASEKIFPPFPQTIEEAHARGHVAKSAYLSTSILLLFTGIYFKFFGYDFSLHLVNSIRHSLSTVHQSDENAQILASIKMVFSSINFILFLWFLLLGISILINILQSGMLFNISVLAPDISRLDFVQGLGRIFSQRNIIRILIGLLVIIIVLLFVFVEIYSKFNIFLSLANLDFYSAAKFFGNIMINILLIIGVILVIIGIVDYIYQRWQYIQDLYLTKSEFMQELKRFEGDPRIKEQWRRMHREIVRQASLKEVPNATVVVTNPIHLAVALQYNVSMVAPKVISKGKGLLAQKIKTMAKEYNIPIVERPEIARLLYKLNIGQYIPRNLYVAISEILKYVYMLKPQLLGVQR